MESGIYKITNIENGKFYIGSAVNISGRWSVHKHMLRNNKHKNSYLQCSWNKHNEGSFLFEVIEIIEDIDTLIKREQFYLDLYKCYNRDIGYNINIIANNRLGVKASDITKERISKSRIALNFKHTDTTKILFSKQRSGDLNAMFGMSHSKEAKEKMKIISSTGELKSEVYSGKGNPFYGKSHSAETKMKISNGNKGKRSKSKLSDQDLIDIYNLYTSRLEINLIAEKYNMSKSGINKIISKFKKGIYKNDKKD